MKTPDSMLVAITCADGTVAIMTFITCEYGSDDRPRWTRLATRENVEAEIARSSWPPEKTPIQSWRFIQPGEVPTDRTYRNAWRDTGAVLEHDMVHAREIHRDFLRQARAPMLEALDAEYFLADEAGDLVERARVTTEKQALRDVTRDPAIEAAKTIEELKAVWPLGLTKR